MRTLSFGEEELIEPVRPVCFGGRLTLSPAAFRPARLPEPFVAELSDATLVGPHAVPFTREGRMLLTSFRDSVGLLGAEQHPELEDWVKGTRAPEPIAEEIIEAIGAKPVLSLVHRMDENYFHWLVDICGQLEGLRAYSEITGRSTTVLIRAGARSFVRESLGLLGFDADAIVEWPMRWAPDHTPSVSDLRVAPVPKLVVVSWRGYYYGCSGRALRWLRDTFLAAANANGPPGAITQRHPSHSGASKIYVQRPHGAWRSIENEQAVRDLLEHNGYELVRPEDHSLREQIVRFSKASSIVAMHGAGLTNLLFAPTASVIELASTYGGSDYMSMCAGLGNPYTRVQCESRGEDIHVDLSALSSALSEH